MLGFRLVWCGASRQEKLLDQRIPPRINIGSQRSHPLWGASASSLMRDRRRRRQESY